MVAADQPAFPAFLFYEKPWQIFWVPASIDELLTYSLKDALQMHAGRETFFDAKGNTRYREINTVAHYSFLRKLLAYSVYNPRIKVESKWLPQGKFTLDQLKERVRQCVVEDDDVLTQFVEADELIARVNRVATFEQLVMEINDATNGD